MKPLISSAQKLPFYPLIEELCFSLSFVADSQELKSVLRMFIGKKLECLANFGTRAITLIGKTKQRNHFISSKAMGRMMCPRS